MDYSLQNLNKIAILRRLTLNDFIEKLNLIGLEVDNISFQKDATNLSLDNISLLLKIPANREDLLNETFFIHEISTIFLLQIVDSWDKLKFNYFFLLNQKYSQYSHYSTIFITGKTEKIVTYCIEIENIKRESSPFWLSNKLSQLGIESTNNIFDILRLVFKEWGHNINLFENSRDSFSKENHFQLECLKKNECFFEFDQEKKTLYPGTIVLKKGDQILTFLGNISSVLKEKDEISSLVIETTFYDIHKNELLLNTLNSKISLKYLRQACLETFKSALQRVLTLFEIVTSGRILPTIYRTKEQNLKRNTTKILRLRKKKLVNFLNISSPDPVIFQKASLDLVCENQKEYYFKIPFSRQDLTREIDLIEEYSRFIGYQNFQEILPFKNISSKFLRHTNFIRNFFLNYGFHEIITNPISDLDNQKDFSILITNPLNNELSVLRHSLIPKMLNVFESNSRSSCERMNFFEMGRSFKRMKNEIIEQDKLAGIFQFSMNKSTKKSSSDWFVAKGFLENFLANFGYKQITIRRIQKPVSFYHSTRSIVFLCENKIIGIFGEVDPLLKKQKYSHVKGSFYLFEFDLNFFPEWRINTQVTLLQEYSKYPLIVKDLSLTLAKEIHFDVLKSFLFLQSFYLKKVKFFDIYFEEEISNKVNIGIRLEFQSQTETLTNEFIESEVIRIRKVLIDTFSVSN